MLEPNIEVNFSKRDGLQAKESKEKLARLSEGLYHGRNSIFWENEFGFVTYIYGPSNDRWIIHAYHFDLLENKGKEEKLKNFTRSMRWIVHFPIFSLLEFLQQKKLVHASVLSKNNKALVLAGLNKVGKSSLARYIYEKYDFKFMSDNFLLTDGKKVFGFPEMNRLSTDSLSNLNLNISNTNLIYEKHHIPFEKDRLELESEPKNVFILRNSDSIKIEPIDSILAVKILDGIHKYLQEFPEYTFYSIFYSLNSWEKKNTDLFPEDTNFYFLSFPLDWSLEKTSKEVMKCISTF